MLQTALVWRKAVLPEPHWMLGLAQCSTNICLVQLTYFPDCQEIDLRILRAPFLLLAHLVKLLNSTGMWSPLAPRKADKALPAAFPPRWVAQQPLQLAPAELPKVTATHRLSPFMAPQREK